MSHIEELVDINSPSAFTVPGTPEVQIQLRPEEAQFELRIPGDVSTPDVAAYRFLSSRRVRSSGNDWNALTISWNHTPAEAYLFICDVVERMQTKHESLATSVEVVLRGIGSILRRQSSLTRDQEVGLFGELLVLNFLLGELTGRDAIRAWKGPTSEEHDFALSEVDLEVKTTTSERRLHWITGEKQLQPVKGRPLKLVSIQITPKIGAESCSLPGLVQHVAERLGQDVFEFERILEGFGFVAEDAELYPTEWALRDAAKCFPVDKTFPKITGAELAKLGTQTSRIRALKYQVDVADLTADLNDRFGQIVVPGA